MKEFDIEKFVDYDLQFEKTFSGPIKIILDCLVGNRKTKFIR
jgi:hypothetical protein